MDVSLWGLRGMAARLGLHPRWGPRCRPVPLAVRDADAGGGVAAFLRAQCRSGGGALGKGAVSGAGPRADDAGRGPLGDPPHAHVHALLGRRLWRAGRGLGWHIVRWPQHIAVRRGISGLHSAHATRAGSGRYGGRGRCDLDRHGTVLPAPPRWWHGPGSGALLCQLPGSHRRVPKRVDVRRRRRAWGRGRLWRRDWLWHDSARRRALQRLGRAAGRAEPQHHGHTLAGVVRRRCSWGNLHPAPRRHRRGSSVGEHRCRALGFARGCDPRAARHCSRIARRGVLAGLGALLGHERLCRLGSGVDSAWAPRRSVPRPGPCNGGVGLGLFPGPAARSHAVRCVHVAAGGAAPRARASHAGGGGSFGEVQFELGRRPVRLGRQRASVHRQAGSRHRVGERPSVPRLLRRRCHRRRGRAIKGPGRPVHRLPPALALAHPVVDPFGLCGPYSRSLAHALANGHAVRGAAPARRGGRRPSPRGPGQVANDPVRNAVVMVPARGVAGCALGAGAVSR
mmetsp:Transcript_23424/g.88953  ORF Transcript_23424/g.88953 Transcript_23424/m.88953 type:complete len:510 (+) Transcript_23424:990-2519(+)